MRINILIILFIIFFSNSNIAFAKSSNEENIDVVKNLSYQIKPLVRVLEAKVANREPGKFPPGELGNFIELTSLRRQFFFITDKDQHNLNALRDITIELWVNMKSLGDESGAQVLVAKWEKYNKYGKSYIFQISSKNQLEFSFEDSYNNVSRAISVPVITDVGRWYHVSVILQTAPLLITFCVNGVEIPSTMTDTSARVVRNSSASFTVGAIYDNFYISRLLDAKIDELRVWSYARSPSEIANSMDKKISSYEINLQGYWPFDLHFLDLSINFNNLVPVHSPPFSFAKPALKK